VFEAIKLWRQNKTTVVITHDLSQITPEDFVYVLKGGQVVEQGYRYDLESVPSSPLDPHADEEEEGKGEFRKMMEAQQKTGGYLPVKEVEDENAKDRGDSPSFEEDPETDSQQSHPVPAHLKHQSIAIRPLTLGNWMFDVVADLVSTQVPNAAAVTTQRPPSRLSRLTFSPTPPSQLQIVIPPSDRARRPLSIQIPSPTTPTAAYTVASRRFSLPFTPTSPTFAPTDRSTMLSKTFDDDDDDEAFEKEKQAIGRSASYARIGRQQPPVGRVARARWDAEKIPAGVSLKLDNSASDEGLDVERLGFWALMRSVYPTIPHKPFVFLGLIVCCLSGAMTPIFSFLLSRLLFEVAIGARDVSTINKFGGIVLSIAAIDGILLGSKYFIMESCGTAWITHIRGFALSKVLAQDKKYFDKPANAPTRVVQVLVKDGDDARNLVSVVWGQFCVVGTMLGVGLVWALVRGWQLTLVGFAIAPVFAVTMMVQTRLVSRCEIRNKRAREEVAKVYYEVRLFFLFRSRN